MMQRCSYKQQETVTEELEKQYGVVPKQQDVFRLHQLPSATFDKGCRDICVMPATLPDFQICVCIVTVQGENKKTASPCLFIFYIFDLATEVVA